MTGRRSLWSPGRRGRTVRAGLAGALALIAARPSDGQGAAGRGAAAPPVVVVDAPGQTIGSVAFTSTEVSVVVRFRRGDREILLEVSGERFIGQFADVVYETDDCSGQPWVAPDQPSQPDFGVGGIGNPNLAYAASGPLETRSIRSRWGVSLTQTGCLPQPVAPTPVFPAVLLEDLATFVPPFRLR